MSLVELKLPLDSVNRIVSAFERIAISLENLEKWMIIPPMPEPVYDKTKRHITETNWQLIADIEALNAARVRQGLPTFTVDEAAAHLRRDAL